MSTSTVSSFQLKAWHHKGLQAWTRPSSSSSSLLKIPSVVHKYRAKSAQSTGPVAGLNLTNGLDIAAERKAKGKSIHQLVDRYGMDISDHSSMLPDKGTTSSHDHTGGTTGLLIWAVSVGSILLVGALLILMTGVCYVSAPAYTSLIL